MAKRKAKSPKVLPATIAELPADTANPREIESGAAAGLGHSLETFGDVGVITFNLETNQLVAGHQRVRQLFEKFGPLPIEPLGKDLGRIVTPAGESFTVRFVRWDLSKQRAANIAANAGTIQGKFVDDKLELILTDIRANRTDDFDAMLLGELFGVDTEGGDGGKLKDQPVKEPPNMAWALVGIPVSDYGEISSTIEKLAENPKTTISITANNG